MGKTITGTWENGDRFLRLVGEWSPEFERQLAAGDWDVLSLFGADLSSFAPLVPFADKIKRLNVSSGIESSKGLEALTQLEDLALRDYPKPAPDFRKLAKLRKLEVLWDSRRKTACLANSHLESLCVTGFGDQDLTALQSLSSLSHLDLRQGSLRSLSGSEDLDKLKQLRLIRLRNFEDLSAISHCRELNHLETSHLPNLLNVDAIKGLSNLTTLELDADNACIDNLDWLADMPRLERLMLSVKAQDIDWNIVAHHPSLTWMAVTANEGYAVTDDDIEAVLQTGPRKPTKFQRLTGTVPGFIVEWGNHL